MKKALTLAVAILLLTACSKKKASDPLADSGRTQRTENLLTNLKAQADTAGYMFGHHDDTVYGIGWEGDSARSDVKSVCGDFPAVISFDLGHIELGDSVNLDRVPFDRIRQEILNQYNRGGMISLSWHLDNPISGGSSWVADSLRSVETKTVGAILEGGEKHEIFLSWIDKVADFFNSLETPYGVKVPVLFRPWHEHTGSWFWWGQAHCTADQYKKLWQMTVDRLKAKGVVNALYAYSPGTEPDGDEMKYLERYPGDDISDVLGLDCYCNGEENDTMAYAAYAAQLDKNLGMVSHIAKQHNKAFALTETGYEGLKYANWWTGVLQPVLDKYAIAYVLVWRNARERPTHYYAPFPGQQTVSDFVKFYNAKRTLFMHDVNALYLR